MSHGPLMPRPANVSTTRPKLLSTSRHPALARRRRPSAVGRLPTTTHPLFRMVRAVVRPIPPGHAPGRSAASICANRLTLAVRGDLDDRRPPALLAGRKVLRIVEVADKNVASAQMAEAVLDYGDTVGIDVPVRWHRGCDDRCRVEAAHERMLRSRVSGGRDPCGDDGARRHRNPCHQGKPMYTQHCLLFLPICPRIGDSRARQYTREYTRRVIALCFGTPLIEQ